MEATLYTSKRVERSRASRAGMVEYNQLQIDDLSDLVRLTGGDLDGENRTRIMVCITMDSHGRDIVQKLIREKVSDATEFQWQSPS